MIMDDRKGRAVFERLHTLRNNIVDVSCTEDVVQLAQKLSEKSKAYEENLLFLWNYQNGRRTAYTISIFAHSHLGTLLQMEDQEARAVLREMKRVVKAVKLHPIVRHGNKDDKRLMIVTEPGWDEDENYWPIVLGPDWKRILRDQGVERYAEAEDGEGENEEGPTRRAQGKRPRNQHPQGMNNLSLDDERPSKRSKTGFRPQDGDWKCGLCLKWNRKYWSSCQNSFSGDVGGTCSGTMRDDVVEENAWETLK